ncbi:MULTISPECIES: MinD/ParA family ATP-binding protein [Microbacterium]|uniref:MinD/ParA family ATP-binding protein n=1 Tax=Microbacterium TaxID=33882 RepID=UPI0024AF7F4C|nr:ATPase [Microbacterium barkeri]MDI6943494.1 ATPase [Microbacterium barkeri]
MLDDSSQAGLSAVIRPDGSAELTVDETPQQITTTLVEDARREIVRRAAEIAAMLSGPVHVTVHEPDGDWPLLVHPDGRVDSDEGAAEPAPAGGETADDDLLAADTQIVTRIPVTFEPSPQQASAPAPTPAPAPAPARAAGQPGPMRTGSAPQPASAAPQPPSTQAQPASAPADGGAQRPSFLAPERIEEPATRGWRGALVRAGMRVPPGSAERAEREDQAAVSQHWAGPRTIAVVNGKGGSGKTPTTILTAAVFARFGGAGVLAWDNNQTRGTLGWRTEQGPHESTLHELLPETDHLLSSSAQSADLARFVHHQTRDRFDVLRSQPMALAEQQRIDAADVDRIHAVAAKYYRLIVMDSGNDESDPVWLQMIDHTDQLVVATTSRAEHAEAGALLLEALAMRDERSARLARNAVAVVSQADPNAPSSEHRKVVDGYRALARDVVSIPYDPAMIGGLLHYGALKPATQRAWLSAGAAIARGFDATSA